MNRKPTPKGNSDSAQATKKDRNKKIVVAVLSVLLVIAILTQPDAVDDTDLSTLPGTTHPVTPVSSVPTSAGAKKTPELDATANQSTPANPEPIRAGDGTQASTVADDSMLTETITLSRLNLDSITSLQLLYQPPMQRQIDTSGQQQSVNAVYGAGNRKSALVGRVIVNPGQMLPRGGKVVNVTNDGIEVGID